MADANYQREWRKRDPERTKGYSRKLRQERKRKGICRTCKQPLAENSTCFCEEHSKKNIERLKEYNKIRKRYPLLNKFKRMKQRQPCSMSYEEFEAWYVAQEEQCCYCGIDVSLLRYEDKKQNTLTVDRKDSTKGYDLDNICVCCYKCNNMKRAFFRFDEWLSIATMFIKPRIAEYHNLLPSDLDTFNG